VTATVVVGDYAPIEAGACRVIAEAGANHNNSVERALEMAERAASAGAWAIKFQLYKAASISVRESPKYWADEIGTDTQFEAFQRSDRLDYGDYRAVAEACRDLGIIFFATPFDLAAVEALEEMRAPLYKIASGDITHRPLLEAVAATGKPVLLSTGASTEDEIRRAVEWTGLGPDKVVLLVCTLTYPTADEDADFARIETFRREFDPYPIGVSDHTLGTAGGWLAGALGAVCIEKHYTLDKSLPDVPDHKISVDPEELAELVEACDKASVLRGGDPAIGVRPSEEPARESARRSIVLERAVEAGQTLSRADVGFKRPGTGIPPFRVDEVLGRTATRRLEADTLLEAGDVE
jgi:N-acetylneuraminate synthase